jgi:hypothetical protein
MRIVLCLLVGVEAGEPQFFHDSGDLRHPSPDGVLTSAEGIVKGVEPASVGDVRVLVGDPGGSGAPALVSAVSRNGEHA